MTVTTAPGFEFVDRESAMAVRRAVLGDEHVDRSVAATTDITAAFQDLATGAAWGGLWSRDQLERPTRSLVTIAILAALGREGELRMHLRSALKRTGASPEDLAEVLLHVSIYAGLPAGNEGFRLLAEILAEEADAAPDDTDDSGSAPANDGATS